MPDSSRILSVGDSAALAANAFTGSVDEARIVKGYGLYTADFTPPTEAFPDS